MSNSSPMYRHLPTQNYQAPYDPALLAAAFHRSTASRPLSWHPASLGTATYPENFPAATHNDMGAMGMASQPLDVSPPVMTNANMLQPYPLPTVPMPSDACFPDMQYTTSMQQPSLMGMSGAPVDPIAWDTAESHSINPPMSDNWAFDMMSMNNSMPSADVAGSDGDGGIGRRLGRAGVGGQGGHRGSRDRPGHRRRRCVGGRATTVRRPWCHGESGDECRPRSHRLDRGRNAWFCAGHGTGRFVGHA